MKRKWLMLAISLFSVFSFYFAMQSIPPVIPQIMEEFNLSHAETSLLMLLVALPAIFLALPVGILTVKWGPRRVGGSGLVLSTAGVLTTYLANSFLWLEIGRFILGIGGIFVVVSAYSSISHWFSREELGKAMGVLALNMPIATVMSFNLLPKVASGFGWKISFLIATVILCISTLVYFSLMEEKLSRKQAAGMLRELKNKQIWLLGVIWVFFVMAGMSYMTWAGTFFMELKNIPSNIAFFMASFWMIAALVMHPIAGTLSDRLGKRKIFLMVASLGMCVTFLLIPGLSLPILFLIVVLLAISATFITPVLYSLPSEILSPKMVGLGFGVLYTCWGMGAASGPTLVGYIRDTFPGELSIYVVMATFSFLAFICAGLLKTR